MKRREFIAGFRGIAVWPQLARAQQVDRAPRIGVLMNRAATVGQLSSSILILLPPCLFAFSKLSVPFGQ